MKKLMLGCSVFLVGNTSVLADEPAPSPTPPVTPAEKNEPIRPAPPKAVPPPLLQSQVKGLLVITLPDGSHAGTASQMNATAVEMSRVTGFSLRFNQKVGPMMKSATQEVEKLMKVRHQKILPKGYAIEFGFSDKHSLKDGPSAAVACALMADAVITGKPLDQKFAATGDLTATGEVRPVGGVGAKIRGASRKNCDIFSVPVGNISAVSDLYITDGLKSVAGIQIISVKSFDDAIVISRQDKAPAVAEALKDYEIVKKSVLRNAGNASHPKVQEKLRSILDVIPSHQSARLIALHGQRRGPKTLSLIGSLTAIDQAAVRFVGVLKNEGIASTKGLGDNLRDTVFNLTRIEKKVDPRTKGYLRAYQKIAFFYKDRREKKYISDSEEVELLTLINTLRSEYRKVRQNREIQEQLLDQ